MHLCNGRSSDKQREMNVIASLRVKAIDKVSAFIHAGSVGADG